MIRFVLTCIVIGYAASFFLVDKYDMHMEHYAESAPLGLLDGKSTAAVAGSAPNYDVDGLNRLVDRLERRNMPSADQAAEIANLWGITKDDLDSKVNIFGERE